METEWKEYPIFHLDLNARNYTDRDALLAELNKHLEAWEHEYGAEFKDRAPEERFQHVIVNAYKKTSRKVVILVDEYDKPLLQMFGNKTMQEEYRRILKAFYGVVKTMDAYIQFGFITSVTKFSKVSVFSDLNNLTDISMDRRYVDICGITEQEIKTGLDEEVAAMAEANGISKVECYHKLRQSYDGYHFEAETIGIYNPYSLLSALSSKAFKDYWFATGTPSYLIKRLQHTNYPLDCLGKEELTADVLGNIDTIDLSPVPMLYQSGYLTLKGYNEEFEMYRLGFPNLEVERGFTRYLIPYYTNLKSNQGQFFVANFVRELRNGQVEAFMQRLESLFTDGDYQVAGDAELYFQNVVWVIFKMIGFYTEVEHHTTDGRIDMLIKTDGYIYIIEFKLDKTAEEALRQIEEKQYIKPFEHDQRPMYKIGINFSTQTRRISDWKVVEQTKP